MSRQALKLTIYFQMHLQANEFLRTQKQHKKSEAFRYFIEKHLNENDDTQGMNHIILGKYNIVI